MTKYADAKRKLIIAKALNKPVTVPALESMGVDEALEIADRLKQAESELKAEYALINDWYMNKFNINEEHPELEIEALHFTGMIMQTIGYLLDALADIRGDE